MTTQSSLQVAQILADLNDLQNTDPSSAATLLSANQAIAAKLQRRRSKPSILTDPPRFDKLGRRIIGPLSRVPSYKRSDSTFSRTSSKFGGDGSEGFVTPLETPGEDDEDMERARTLVELYEMRGKMKQWGDTGLTRAKERVDDVVERYRKKEAEEREKAARTIY